MSSWSLAKLCTFSDVLLVMFVNYLIWLSNASTFDAVTTLPFIMLLVFTSVAWSFFASAIPLVVHMSWS